MNQRTKETQHSGSISRLWWMSALVVFEAVEASHVLFDCRTDLSAAGSSFGLSCPEKERRSSTCSRPFAAMKVWTESHDGAHEQGH